MWVGGAIKNVLTTINIYKKEGTLGKNMWKTLIKLEFLINPASCTATVNVGVLIENMECFQFKQRVNYLHFLACVPPLHVVTSTKT